jgi:two-component system, OmpR family, response regulator
VEAAALDTCATHGVSVLSWPQDAHVRAHLAAFRQPRILLVEQGATPPVPVDELEDWVRTPTDPEDLGARSRELHRRATDVVPQAPTIDDQGLLWVGRRWVDLTPAQAPVVSLLVENLERVVRYEAVVSTYERVGGSSHAASVRTLLTRIGHRVRPVGLDLVTVRRRGVLLTQQPRMAV